MTTAAPDPQTSLYETELEDPDLEAALEKRQTLKDERKALNKTFQDADAVAREKIEKADLGVDAPVRCGRFVVRLGQVKARVVNFETDPTTRLFISTLPDE